ncbi:MAG: S4 domain-containing protein [Nanoarchaeota archaeon]|nr:S4 domain-containing protein [Nanoarchaeota archaeon]
MHQTRQEVSMKLPIPRKGTKYVVRAIRDVNNSVPVLIALREMLKMARTAKEVEQMIKQKLLKINGRIVEDYHESINLFNILEADKSYVLTLSPTGRFVFEETKAKSERLCKVINKTLIKKGKIQLNMHEGSNFITSEKIEVGDSVYVDFTGRIKKHVALEKGKSCFIIGGKYSGSHGTVEKIEGRKVTINLKEKGISTTLDKKLVVVL